MKGFASWFGVKGNEEEKQKILILNDPSKGWKKRFAALLQLLKHFEKNADKTNDFLKSYQQVGIEICTNFLKNDTTRTRGRQA